MWPAGGIGSATPCSRNRLPVPDAEVLLDFRLHEPSLVGVAHAGKQVALPPVGPERVQPVSGCRARAKRDEVLSAPQLLNAICWYASHPEPRHWTMPHAQFAAADD